MTASETQIGGNHYKALDVEPYEALRAWLTPEQYVGYQLGTAIVYLARFNAAGFGKGGLVDVQKARHTLEFLEEFLRAGAPTPPPAPEPEQRPSTAPPAYWQPGTVLLDTEQRLAPCAPRMTPEAAQR